MKTTGNTQKRPDMVLYRTFRNLYIKIWVMAVMVWYEIILPKPKDKDLPKLLQQIKDNIELNKSKGKTETKEFHLTLNENIYCCQELCKLRYAQKSIFKYGKKIVTKFYWKDGLNVR